MFDLLIFIFFYVINIWVVSECLYRITALVYLVQVKACAHAHTAHVHREVLFIMANQDKYCTTTKAGDVKNKLGINKEKHYDKKLNKNY